MTTITDLRCEYRREPLAAPTTRPRLSWLIHSDRHDVRQRHYRVRLRTTDEEVVWDSGQVDSDRQNHIVVPVELTGGTNYRWSVTVGLDDGTAATSDDTSFSTAPDPSVWAAASWIGLNRPNDEHDDFRQSPYLRTTFHVAEGLVSARLHCTAAGLYAAFVNGQSVTTDLLTPGWTDYAHRLQYQTYEVGPLLRAGENGIGAVLADGWYAGNIGPNHARHFWGERPGFRAVLVLRFADGSSQTIATNPTWAGRFGPIVFTDMLQGEIHDARRDLGDWSVPGGGPTDGWRAVDAVPGIDSPHVPSPCQPARAVAEFTAVDVTEGEPGSYLYDFGQNLAGFIRLALCDVAPGTICRLRFAETLDDSGRLYTENLRGARATDTFVAAGGEHEEWAPTFTFHGFRYVELTGVPNAPLQATLTAVAISSAEIDAQFDCDVPALNQLHHNVQWGMRSNFIEVPTDCPQRDERLGWMGDAQVFAATALLEADVAAFYTKWLHDVLDARDENGVFRDIAPAVVLYNTGSPGYGDAGVIVPWQLYQSRGDEEVLRQMYPAMRRWLDHIAGHNPDLIWRNNRENDYGDWLQVAATTSPELVATAYFGHSARLTATIARIIGAADADQVSELADRVAAAFCTEYWGADDRLASDTQGAYVLALRFGLLAPPDRPRAAQRLADLVAATGTLTTGFLSVAHLLPALTDIGRSDLAYRLLLSEDYPSWLYQVRNGATTIWERWDGWRSDAGFQDPGMNSFNHYAFGSVAEWLVTSVAGIAVDPVRPGYEHVLFRPQVDGPVGAARARLRTIRGEVAISWRRAADRLDVAVEIPANAGATLTLPDGWAPTDPTAPTADLGSGRHELTYRRIDAITEIEAAAR